MTEGRSVVVLVVDDDRVDRESTRRALLRSGLAVELLEADTAVGALAALERQQVDCVFVDFLLPDHDGMWLVRQIRERNPDCAIVALTGQGDEETAAELMKAGASEYLPKGAASPDRVEASLQSALRLAAAQAAARTAQEELKHTEERFRLALDVTKLIVYEQDTELRYTYVHNPWGQWRLDDVQGRTDRDLFGTDGVGLETIKSRVLRGESVRQDVEVEGKWFDLVAHPRLGPGGRVVGVVGTAQDITERKRAAAFEQQLVGIVSHDLRNPIGTILMTAGMLLRRPDLDNATRRAAERISAVAQRTGRMIRDLLDFTQARIGRGIPLQPRPMDCNEGARQVVEELATLHPNRNIKLHTVGSAEGIWDPDRVSQVLSNLVTNALTYSPPHTTVNVTVRGLPSVVELEVHNLGEPLPKERMASLFEPFERGNARDGRGIGLGLYIVQSVVVSHGGSVSASSSAEDGTRFVVRLPRTTLAATGS